MCPRVLLKVWGYKVPLWGDVFGFLTLLFSNRCFIEHNVRLGRRSWVSVLVCLKCLREWECGLSARALNVLRRQQESFVGSAEAVLRRLGLMLIPPVFSLRCDAKGKSLSLSPKGSFSWPYLCMDIFRQTGRANVFLACQCCSQSKCAPQYQRMGGVISLSGITVFDCFCGWQRSVFLCCVLHWAWATLTLK